MRKLLKGGLVGNEDWIKSLKPGDKVAVESSTIHGKSYSIKTVKNTTKGGKARLENGELYNLNGSLVGEKFSWGNSTRIVQYDQMVKDHFRKVKAVRVINDTNFSKLEISKLARIVDIIEGE